MKFTSYIEERGNVSFPAFTGERVYMQEFFKATGLPDYMARWQTTVDQLLDGVDSDGPIYIMIDQGMVSPEKAHRREGLHIDGYWNPAKNGHGNHRAIVASHGAGHRPMPTHSPEPRHGSHPTHSSSPMENYMTWEESTFTEKEGLILASNISACLGYVGEFDGPIRDGGDCSHVDLNRLDTFRLRSNTVYAGNVTCLHESIPADIVAERTLVRLNVPGWCPTKH